MSTRLVLEGHRRGRRIERRWERIAGVLISVNHRPRLCIVFFLLRILLYPLPQSIRMEVEVVLFVSGKEEGGPVVAVSSEVFFTIQLTWKRGKRDRDLLRCGRLYHGTPSPCSRSSLFFSFFSSSVSFTLWCFRRSPLFRTLQNASLL